MNNLKEIQQIKLLIAKGKKNGFLTFEEVGKTLPTEMNTPDQLEEVMSIFDQMNIVIVDSEENGKKLTSETADTDEELDLVPSEGDDAADYSSRSTDPVRMYLREMGAVPLLDREGEVVIAKKIENGELEVLYALVEVPVAVEELVQVGEDLKNRTRRARRIQSPIACGSPRQARPCAPRRYCRREDQAPDVRAQGSLPKARSQRGRFQACGEETAAPDALPRWTGRNQRRAGRPCTRLD